MTTSLGGTCNIPFVLLYCSLLFQDIVSFPEGWGNSTSSFPYFESHDPFIICMDDLSNTLDFWFSVNSLLRSIPYSARICQGVRLESHETSSEAGPRTHKNVCNQGGAGPALAFSTPRLTLDSDLLCGLWRKPGSPARHSPFSLVSEHDGLLRIARTGHHCCFTTGKHGLLAFLTLVPPSV